MKFTDRYMLGFLLSSIALIELGVWQEGGLTGLAACLTTIGTGLLWAVSGDENGEDFMKGLRETVEREVVV